MQCLTPVLWAIVFSCLDRSPHEVPDLGLVSLPAGDWELESVYEPTSGARAYVFRKKAEVIERITIVSFKKHNPDQALRTSASYPYCDMIADSVYEGLPRLWGQKEPSKESRGAPGENGAGHMIRLPKKGDREPLEVTNIYPDRTGVQWMNHGIIASNTKHVFLFVHSSTKVLSPESIQEVYFSTSLKTWPRDEN